MAGQGAGRFGKRAKLLLGLCVAAMLATIVLFTYFVIERPDVPRGSEGPLTQEPRMREPPSVPIPTRPGD